MLSNRTSTILGSLPVAALGLLALTLAGCGAPEASFHFNAVYAERADAKLTVDQVRNIKTVLEAQFGTPDAAAAPSIPDHDVSAVLEPRRLSMAAGPVSRDDEGITGRGLYRENCAHCHGVTGDGRGPTAAFLNPYPRDFRRGTFKFKSTPVGARPTDDDLRRVLSDGIPGTAMPAFKVELIEDEMEAVLQYVKYLAMRGETERAFINYITQVLDEGELLLDPAQDAEAAADGIAAVHEETSIVVSRWINAPSQVVEAPERPEGWNLEESIEKGRELFFGTVANCVKCHGTTALGDGQITDYDEWTKEIEPTKPEELARFLAAGALPPRTIHPRNLRQGVYRGGRRPIDIYWRVKNGIEGTPMPAAPATLSSDDIWHIVDYVRSLPYQPLSRSQTTAAEFQRDRN